MKLGLIKRKEKILCPNKKNIKKLYKKFKKKNKLIKIEIYYV